MRRHEVVGDAIGVVLVEGVEDGGHRFGCPLIEHRAVKDLKVNRRNARSHDDRQVQQIAATMREFGWLVPIVVDEEETVLAGHGRLRAAPLLNMETVPTIQVKHLTPERKRAFMLADNRLAEWDEDMLTIELKELSGLEFDFDFEITGFETKDLDRLEGAAAAKPAEVEVVPHPQDEPAYLSRNLGPPPRKRDFQRQ